MAVTRQENWIGQQRVDVPHLRALEAASAYDWDVFGGIVIGGREPLIVSGFEMVTTGAVGNDAERLIMRVAGGTAIAFEATESGSVFHVPDDRDDETLSPTNGRVSGAFVPNTSNFVGLDWVRAADDTTVDNVAFLQPVTNTEAFETVPLARTIDYRIVISTTEFSATPGIVPVAIVVTDASNKVVSVEDARPMIYRLNETFGWPGGRTEAGTAAARGGDRSILSLKQALDAIMTRLFELGGGEHWYSPTAYRNVRLVGAGAVFVTTGEYWEVVANNAHWKNLKVILDNSTATVNEIQDQTTDLPGTTDLADGECLYVDLDRTQNRTNAGTNPLVPQKAVLSTLGQSATPGQRYVICWRSGSNFFVRDQPYAIGGSFKIATTAAYGTVKISSNPDLGIWDAASPVVPVIAMVAGAGYTATAGGVSHNQDGGVFGTFDTILPSGDILVGRGSTAGDENVKIFTSDSIFQTEVLGYGEQDIGGGGKSALLIDSGADQGTQVGRKRNRVVTHAGISAVEGVRREDNFVESDGGVGVAPTTTTPATVELTSDSRARWKYFSAPDKRWHTRCTLATDVGLDSYTAAGAGVGKTLTANANGALTVDGIGALAGDRILVKNEFGPDNGIYEVTDAGSGGTPWILTRATDADENEEVVNGLAVYIFNGTINIGTAWVLTTPDAIQVDAVAQEWATDSVSNFIVELPGVYAATDSPLPANTPAGQGVGKTLTANANGALVVDGFAGFAFGDRILVKDEVDPIHNGIYTISDVGSAGTPWVLVRATDADEPRQAVCGIGVNVFFGTFNAGTYWKLTTPNEIVVDQTTLLFSITSTETVDQLCIRWWDGSVGVIQQSPPYTPVFN
jgi:hypothetical protein